jgi:hypothetical protein
MIRFCSNISSALRAPSGHGKAFRFFSSITEGDRLIVEWGGASWDAEVGRTEKDKVLVKYTNWSDHWDEWIPLDSDRLKGPREQKSSVADDRNRKRERSKDRRSVSSQKGALSEIPSPLEEDSIQRREDHVVDIQPKRADTVMEIEVRGIKLLTSQLRNGRILFKDLKTGLISWDFPNAQEGATLPAGYMTGKDLEGREYYFNTINRKSQYSIPTVSGEIAARNAEKAQAVTAPWEVLFGADGTPYYHNVDTGAVTWTAEEKPVAEPKEVTSETKEESKWEVHYTEDGFPFYYSHATGESVWEIPKEQADESSGDDENWWEVEILDNRSALVKN